MEEPAATLPDDVVLEILAQVKDVATLFRIATACKRWSRLIVADRSVLPCCRSSPFVGFFTRQRCRGRLPTPWFILGPHPLLCPLRRMLRSLIPGCTARLFDYAVPLVSRHGLLLLRLNHRNLNPMLDILLAVCDALAGTVHMLPPLAHSEESNDLYNMIGYAILTAEDCPSSDNIHRRSFFFKVIIVTVGKERMDYVIHTFSSDRESGCHTCFAEDRGLSGTLRQHNAAVCHGTAHWLFRGASGTYYILGVRLDTGHSFSNVLKPEIHDISLSGLIYDKPYLTVDARGRLALLCLRKDGGRLDIWTSDDNGRSFHTSIIRYTREAARVYTCLGEKNGTMLVMDNHHRVYVTDVPTGVMQEVTQWPWNLRLSRENAVLFEMDWPAFFASRLGVASR